jgi:hypothetical protein
MHAKARQSTFKEKDLRTLFIFGNTSVAPDETCMGRNLHGWGRALVM